MSLIFRGYSHQSQAIAYNESKLLPIIGTRFFWRKPWSSRTLFKRFEVQKTTLKVRATTVFSDTHVLPQSYLCLIRFNNDQIFNLRKWKRDNFVTSGWVFIL